LGDLACTRAGFSDKQGLHRQPLRFCRTLARLQKTRLGDADDLVREERVEVDTLVDLRLAHKRNLDASCKEPLDDLAGGCDLDLNCDIGVIATEAPERVREEIHAGGGRRPDVDRACVESGQGVKFLLACGQRGERLTRARGKDAARLG
jgi:hypothetical protein